MSAPSGFDRFSSWLMLMLGCALATWALGGTFQDWWTAVWWTGATLLGVWADDRAHGRIHKPTSKQSQETST